MSEARSIRNRVKGRDLPCCMGRIITPDALKSKAD